MWLSLKIRRAVPVIFSITFLCILLLFPQSCAHGAEQGMKNCAEILIPSLFPYMFISTFIMRSGVVEKLKKFPLHISEKIFGLPSICAPATFMSMIGGFPVGAKCVQILYSSGKITSCQAEKMMHFCVCSGPAFMITAVGTVMLKNRDAGIILYVSQVISCVVIGILCGRKKEQYVGDVIKNEDSEKFVSETAGVITDSSGDAARSMLEMTALVILFSVVIRVVYENGVINYIGMLLSNIGISERVTETICTIFLEVTSACNAVKQNGLPLWWYSAAVGFGGLCVHFQILSILRDIPLKFWKYLLFRVLNSVLSCTVTYVLCLIFKPTANVFSIFGGHEANVTSVTYMGSAALIIMCAVFVLTMQKKELSRRFFG